MYKHAESKESEDLPVRANNLRYLRQIPSRPDLVHHLAGGVPSHLIGHGGVEVGTTTEEEACEADEDEGEEGGPNSGQCAVVSG